MILWPFPESAPNWSWRCQKRLITMNINTVTEILKISNQEIVKQRAEQNNGEIKTVINTEKLKWDKRGYEHYGAATHAAYNKFVIKKPLVV